MNNTTQTNNPAGITRAADAAIRPLDDLKFQCIGHFNVDTGSMPSHLVFNRTVTLKDSWGKVDK